MNIFSRVTLASLKKNKVRTIVTVIGIILSTAMICAVTTFASSIYNYAMQNAIYIYGDWHGSVSDSEYGVYSKISSSKEIEATVYAKQLGYSLAEGCKNENKPYIYVMGVSQGFEKMLPINITLGEYPKNSNEILLPDHLYENGGVEYEVGDSIVLSLGKRMVDGYELSQNNPFYIYTESGETEPNGEILKVSEQRSYKVVGFYERPQFEEYTAPGYSAITLDEGAGDGLKCDIWFRMKRAENVYSFMKQYKIEGNTNSSVLRFSGISRYDGYGVMITSLAAIVIALIMFGSISLIYNAFSISVSERTKQFGLLASVGATKKQLKRMVRFEAFAVSLIGIPIGILSGIGGIWITLLIIGHKFESLIGYPIPLRISVSLLSVIVAVAIALLTVLLSAAIPSKRATRVTAIEAIRQSKDINVERKNVKTSGIILRLFGLPGMLASKYYKRSRKKYRATVLSLFMSVVLFISASAFTQNLTRSVSDSLGSVKTDIALYGYDGEFGELSYQELLELLRQDKGVNKVAFSKSATYNAVVDSNSVTKEYKEYYLFNNSEAETYDSMQVLTELCFVDDEAFSKMLKENGLDFKDYFDRENPLGIAIDGRTFFDNEEGKYVSMNVFNNKNPEITADVTKEIDGYYYDREEVDSRGEKVYVYKKDDGSNEIIELSEKEAVASIKLNVGKIIYDLPFFVDVNSRLSIIYPYSLMDSFFPDDGFGEYKSCTYYITTDTHKETYKEIEKTLLEEGVRRPRLYDYASDVEENRNIITIIEVFSCGFIVLISLIAAANVFNTISTNISLRRREFAMLKSVGMTARGFNKMMNFECLLYGTRAIFWGLPVSIAVCYIIHLSVSAGYENDFILPITAIGIAVFSVFAVVFVTMMYSMRKVKKDNPIETLKNENL